MGFEPTTLCLASVEREKPISEAKQLLSLISSCDCSAFFQIIDQNAIPKGPLKNPYRPSKSETVSPLKGGSPSSAPASNFAYPGGRENAGCACTRAWTHQGNSPAISRGPCYIYTRGELPTF